MGRLETTDFTHDLMIQHTGRWTSDPSAFSIAFSMVFGANFNKFGVLKDLNDPMTRRVTFCIVFGINFNKFDV
jgi:hypothetical protein